MTKKLKRDKTGRDLDFQGAGKSKCDIGYPADQSKTRQRCYAVFRALARRAVDLSGTDKSKRDKTGGRDLDFQGAGKSKCDIDTTDHTASVAGQALRGPPP